MTWRSLQYDPPTHELLRDGNILVRRQWNTQGTVSKRLYDYRILEWDYVPNKVLARGWSMWMEVPA